MNGALEAKEFDDTGRHGGDLICFCTEAVTVFKDKGALVIISQDYHPPDHISFASTHRARPPPLPTHSRGAARVARVTRA